MIIDQLFTRPLFEQAPMASPEQLAYNRLRAQYDSYQAMTSGGGNTAVSRDPAHAAKLAKVPAEIARMAAALKAKGIDAEAQYDALSGPAAAPVDANQLYGGISEATDPTRAKAQQMIYKYFGQIYDYGDDDGLYYLDLQGELWNQLMDKYNGEIEDIVAREPTEVLMQAAQELKGIAGDMEFDLDEAGVTEAARGHTIEAHGVRGMDRRTWHKTFRNTDQMIAWAEKHDAEIIGTRDLEQARHHNLSPANKGVTEGLTEMDKSEPSAGRDTGPREGPEKIAKPISKEKMTKDAADVLDKAMSKEHKKKDVKESDTLMLKLQRAMVQEGRVKELADDLKTMPDADFMKKYGKVKAAIRKDMKRVDEATPAMPSAPAAPAAPAKPAPQSNRQYAKTYNAATKQWTTNAPAVPAQPAAPAQAPADDADEYNFDSWEQEGNTAVPIKNGVRQNLFKVPVNQVPPGAKITQMYTTYQQQGNMAVPVDANGALNVLGKVPLNQVPKGSKIVQNTEQGALAQNLPTAQPAAAPVNELSTNQLARYKTAAAKDAKRADQAGDFKRGDRRLSGMVQATKKQFDNDAKKVDESRAARRALMARIVNSG
jgi:hypothetical protein